MVDTLDDKKGEDILLLDVKDIASFADYFVFCTATSDRMLDALAKSIKEEVKKEHQLNATIEGNSSSGWLLLDIGDINVHLFSPEQRDYYRLEELWSGGKVLVKLQ